MWLARHSVAMMIVAITVFSIPMVVIIAGGETEKNLPKDSLVVPKILPLFKALTLNHDQNNRINKLLLQQFLILSKKNQMYNEVNRLMSMQQHVIPGVLPSIHGSGLPLTDDFTLEKFEKKQHNLVSPVPISFVLPLNRMPLLPILFAPWQFICPNADLGPDEKCKPKPTNEKQPNSCPEGQTFGPDQKCTDTFIQDLPGEWAKKK